MGKETVAGLLFAGWMVAASSSYGHHSFAAFFNQDETVSVQGVAKEFWF